MEKIPYTVRIKVKLNEKIDGKLLYEAAQEAASRLPYFRVKVELDKEENYTIVHNDASITVCPEDETQRLVLGSEKVNRHLFAITYRDDTAWFSFSHSVTGGFGAMFWVKTTL